MESVLYILPSHAGRTALPGSRPRAVRQRWASLGYLPIADGTKWNRPTQDSYRSIRGGCSTQSLLGMSWKRLGVRRNSGAHLSQMMISAWQPCDLHFENRLRLQRTVGAFWDQGGGTDLHDRLGAPSAARMLIGRLYFRMRQEPRQIRIASCATTQQPRES